MSAAGSAALAECRALLGGERDIFRVVWDEQAGDKDRRLLLMLAGQTPAQVIIYVGRAWCDLRPELRSEIKRKFYQFREWAGRLA